MVSATTCIPEFHTERVNFMLNTCTYVYSTFLLVSLARPIRSPAQIASSTCTGRLDTLPVPIHFRRLVPSVRVIVLIYSLVPRVHVAEVSHVRYTRTDRFTPIQLIVLSESRPLHTDRQIHTYPAYSTKLIETTRSVTCTKKLNIL